MADLRRLAPPEDDLTLRPIASVIVIHHPDFGPLAIKVEVGCPDRVTGLLNVLGEAHPVVRGAVLILAACGEHEMRCGRCDLTVARKQADVEVRGVPEDAWPAWRAERRQRLLRDLLE
jgi:hypothetical protein